MKRSDYATLVDRIRAKLSSWTGRFLSYAGRLQLINSVIYSLINFWLSVFSLPRRCIKQINGLCSSFLWSGPGLLKGKAKIAWADVCRPRHEGGLGLRKIEEANLVSSLKLIWRFLSSSSLWTSWITTYLLRGHNFWSSQVTTTSGSWVWRKLLRLRPIAAPLHSISIGNGHRASFWFDNWCSLGRLVNLFDNQTHYSLGVSVKDTVSDASFSMRRNSQRSDLLQSVSEVATTAFRKLTPNARDKDMWKSREGRYANNFSSKNTWTLTYSASPPLESHEAIWFPNSTPKHSFIVWLANHNRLSTGDRHHNWTTRDQVKCLFCGCLLESKEHLFFICNFSGAIWGASLGNLMPNFNSVSWHVIIRKLAHGLQCKTTNFFSKIYLPSMRLLHLEREEQ